MHPLVIAAVVLVAIWILAVLVLLWSGRKTAAKELVVLLPNLVRLFRGLIGDPRVPRGSKALLLVGAVWLVSPIDLIPEFLPGIGGIDDAWSRRRSSGTSFAGPRRGRSGALEGRPEDDRTDPSARRRRGFGSLMEPNGLDLR